MTKKFVGDLKVSVDSSNNVHITFPVDNVEIPPKQEWSKHAIWQFNGRAYKPLTQKAEDALSEAVEKIKSFGFTKATKETKRKPTSVRYAVLTTGIEPFIYIK